MPMRVFSDTSVTPFVQDTRSESVFAAFASTAEFALSKHRGA